MSITYERMFGNWKNVLQFAAGQDVSRNVRSGKWDIGKWTENKEKLSENFGQMGSGNGSGV